MADRILVDGYCLSRRHAGTGLHRYAVSLLRAIEKLLEAEEGPRFQILVPSLADWDTNGSKPRPDFQLCSTPLMRFHRAWKYGLVNSLAIGKADAVFAPTPISVYLKPMRLAVTIHDVIPLLSPERYQSFMGRVLMHAYTSSMAKADLIFTDSQCSKTDMVLRFGVPEERVIVAYLGYDSDKFKPAGDDSQSRELLRRFGIDQPYILHVGHGDPRKNLVRLVQAYGRLIARRKDIDVQLVLGGWTGWGCEPVLELAQKPPFRGKVILTGPVPDTDLPALYGSAICYAMPSLYEGFGLPVLEAMACGTPVVISNSSSLPEVGGDAALYFRPESVEEMSQVMERILTDSDLREEMSRKGLERVRRFSWEACARTTLAGLKNL